MWKRRRLELNGLVPTSSWLIYSPSRSPRLGIEDTGAQENEEEEEVAQEEQEEDDVEDAAQEERDEEEAAQEEREEGPAADDEAAVAEAEAELQYELALIPVLTPDPVGVVAPEEGEGPSGKKRKEPEDAGERMSQPGAKRRKLVLIDESDSDEAAPEDVAAAAAQAAEFAQVDVDAEAMLEEVMEELAEEQEARRSGTQLVDDADLIAAARASNQILPQNRRKLSLSARLAKMPKFEFEVWGMGDMELELDYMDDRIDFLDATEVFHDYTYFPAGVWPSRQECFEDFMLYNYPDLFKRLIKKASEQNFGVLAPCENIRPIPRVNPLDESSKIDVNFVNLKVMQAFVRRNITDLQTKKLVHEMIWKTYTKDVVPPVAEMDFYKTIEDYSQVCLTLAEERDLFKAEIVQKWRDAEAARRQAEPRKTRGKGKKKI